MKTRLHIYIVILILTFVGIVSQQQTANANQELVLHFTNIDSSSLEAKKTISIVKRQLQDLGVDNIQVKHENQGKLVITYYSHVDVASVKQILSTEKRLHLNYPQKKPVEEDPDGSKQVNYNLDIFEIQTGNDYNPGFDGCIVIEKTESDRYYDPNTFYASSVLNNQNEESLLQVSFKIWKTIGASLDNTSYTIPEVRAGPNKFGNL
ncbi:hypothetical protein [Hanstruepera marina]|uniref:hypothetical protein n=1 Tax=Hanstruepera marina TaxID=2873265 RepID=UPI001CA62456|nr:hypothetical protein [Hanstruepera marina]